MKKFTVEDILAENPCEKYTREYLEELAAGCDNVTAREIAQLDIRVDDRIWILSQLLYRLSPARANRCARLIALSVIDLWDCPDIVWWYLVTGDVAARAAARDAARDAAWAARAAAWDAAWAAAGDAAWAAAGDAAWDAAWSAAWSARDAARDAKMESHMETLVRPFETGV